MRIAVSLPLVALVLSLAAFAPQAQSAPPQVAQTPPMGWNSWNYFAGKVDDKGVRAAADQIVATGMKDAGLHLREHRRHLGRQARRERRAARQREIPRHEGAGRLCALQGLKIGIYSGPGTKTCAKLRGLARPRRAGREDVCRLGHRLPEVRPVQLLARMSWRSRHPTTRRRR